MNFNDIELRLRYPHLFRDQDGLHTMTPQEPRGKQGGLARWMRRMVQHVQRMKRA